MGVRVLLRKDGKPIGNRHYFNRIFLKIRGKAGIRSGLRFRDLRRTAGTEIAAGGGRPETQLGIRPGLPVVKHYEVPSKEASRRTQEQRIRLKVETLPKKKLK
jgi:integrase